MLRWSDAVLRRSALRGKFWQKVWSNKLRIVYDIFDYDATDQK
jgi:hypothetical protein